MAEQKYLAFVCLWREKAKRERANFLSECSSQGRLKAQTQWTQMRCQFTHTDRRTEAIASNGCYPSKKMKRDDGKISLRSIGTFRLSLSFGQQTTTTTTSNEDAASSSSSHIDQRSRWRLLHRCAAVGAVGQLKPATSARRRRRNRRSWTRQTEVQGYGLLVLPGDERADLREAGSGKSGEPCASLGRFPLTTSSKQKPLLPAMGAAQMVHLSAIQLTTGAVH